MGQKEEFLFPNSIFFLKTQLLLYYGVTVLLELYNFLKDGDKDVFIKSG